MPFLSTLMVYGNKKCNHKKEEKAKPIRIKQKDEQGLTMLRHVCTAFVKEGFC